MKPVLHDARDPGDDAEALRGCLVRLGQGGTVARQAAARLYESHAPRFRAFLRMHRLAPEHIEVVVHEVFVRLQVGSGRARKVKSPRAYLWSVLRNAFTDHLRHARRQRRRFAEPATLGTDYEETGVPEWLDLAPAKGSGAERAAHRECLAQVLERFLREQPERASAIALVALEGFEGAELAYVLGKGRRAAREYLAQAHRALRELTQALSPHRPGS